jgi:hypothetical protein
LKKYLSNFLEVLYFNKYLIVAFSLSIILIGCNNLHKEPNLENGLKNYSKSRMIDESIIDGYVIKKWAFQKLDTATYQFIFQLNNDANNDTIEKYGLGFVYYANKEFLPNNNSYLMVQTQPTLISKGNFKYIIETVKPPTTNLDSLHIFLTGRKEYTGVIGNMVRLKNIKL